MTNSQIAQATQVPTSGASRAEDFQPQTRNPQQAPVVLQPNGGLQQVGDRLLLTDNPNVRIIVPTGTGTRTKAAVTTQESGAAGWLVLVVALAAVAVVAGLWWKRKTPSGRTVKT